jgi:hypothetical protein
MRETLRQVLDSESYRLLPSSMLIMLCWQHRIVFVEGITLCRPSILSLKSWKPISIRFASFWKSIEDPLDLSFCMYK